MLLAIACGVSACSKSARPKVYFLDRVQIVDDTRIGNPVLPISSEELRDLVMEALSRSKRFALSAATTRPSPPDSKALRGRVEVAFTRETLDEESGQSKAEVGVVLEVRRLGEVDRYQASGLGRVGFPLADAAARITSFRKALVLALDEVAKSGALQLDSLDKPDEALIADLSSADPRVRDFAVRLVAERKVKAAMPALIERLGDGDREVAMKAVGALGAIGDARAVPALIEMAQTRDPQFVVALVGVVAQLGGKDAEAFLFTLASGHPEEAVRRAAAEAQEQLAHRASKVAGDPAAPQADPSEPMPSPHPRSD